MAQFTTRTHRHKIKPIKPAHKTPGWQYVALAILTVAAVVIAWMALTRPLTA